MRRHAATALLAAALLALPATAWADADTTPPDIEFGGALYTAQVTNVASPEADFTVTDSSGVASVQCAVDGGTLPDCTSPFQMGGLTDGIHTLTVKAVDASPNHNANTQSFQFVVDTIPPTLDLPSSGFSTGAVSWGYSDADGPVTSTCSLSEGARIVMATQSCTPPLALTGATDGHTYTFTVTVTDRAGWQTTSSEQVTVSTTAPTVSIGDPKPAPVSSNRTATLTFTASGGTVSCTLDNGTPTTPCSSPYTTQTLAEGPHVIEVDVDNHAGAIAQAFYSFVVDLTPPSLVIDGTDGAFINTAIGFAYSDVSSPSMKSVMCELDGGFPFACGPTVDLTPLAEGTHTLDVYVTDLAGNTGHATRTIRIDRSPPVLTLQNVDVGDSSATVTFQAGDSGSAVHVDCALDGAPLGPCTTSTSYAVVGLAPGNHTLVVVATDEAGHTNTGTIPVTITGPPASGGTTGGGGATGGDTTAPRLTATLHRHGRRAPTLTLRCEGACTVTLAYTRKGRTLGRTSVRIAAKRTVTVALRLGRKAFGRARSLKVLLRLRAVGANGRAATRTLTVTLRR